MENSAPLAASTSTAEAFHSLVTPQQRVLRAKIAAYASHVGHTGNDRTAAARSVFREQFANEVRRRFPDRDRGRVRPRISSAVNESIAGPSIASLLGHPFISVRLGNGHGSWDTRALPSIYTVWRR